MSTTVVILGAVALAYCVFVAWLGSAMGLRGTNLWVFRGALWLLGLAAAGIVFWLLSNKKKDTSPDKAGAAPQADDDLRQLLREAAAKLADAQQAKGMDLGKLPVVLVLGEPGSAKTSTIVNAGMEAELLAGQVFREAQVVPTPAANFWFAKRAVVVELAGKFVSEGGAWGSVVKRLQPSSLLSAMGRGAQPPRAALVLVDVERLARAGAADEMTTAARTLRARLGEIAKTLGLNLPVYALFTKVDRIPFFQEWARGLTDQEAQQVLGVTLPPTATGTGVYAEVESERLGGAFDELFRSLAGSRTTFLPREHDPSQLPGAYEFPREFRKLRRPVVQFLLDLCRPSQLTVGPFLRGFYFTGVRPVIVSDVSPAAARRAEPEGVEAGSGATRMFRVGATIPAAPQFTASPVSSTRKVPQWVFLTQFFNNFLFSDPVSFGGVGVSTKTSLLRRVLLASACGLCVAFVVASSVSFFQNRHLQNEVLQAARAIPLAELAPGPFPPRDSLVRLESLRQSLLSLDTFRKEGAPLGYRWGLYIGDDLYPEVRRLYFENFQRLLFGQTQAALLDSLRSLPAAPGPEYSPTYDSLKAYLITTSNHDRSTVDFLAPVLMNRWMIGRTVDPETQKLAQRQFDYYAGELRAENPYSSANDVAAIAKARRYLAQFGGLERIYQAMLADAAKHSAPVNFNKMFPGSAEVVLDGYEVTGAFTKAGWDVMKNSLKSPERYFSGEQWVLGDEAGASIDRTSLGAQLTSRYHADFIKNWTSFVAAGNVVRYASLAEAAKKLNTLSGNQSPLLALFAVASRNTAVDDPDVAKVFQPVQAVVAPGNLDRYIDPSNQAYMSALIALQTSMDAAASQPTVSDVTASQTLGNATTAKLAARTVAQAFRIDPQFHIETMSQKLLEDPITNAESLLRGLGPAELNGKGRALCGQYRAVMNKFPFNPAATAQATVADLNGLFRSPDGAIWALYESNLKKLVAKTGSEYTAVPGASVTVTPAFLAFLNRAAAVSAALYPAAATDPRIAYTLKALPVEGIQPSLRLDGQDMPYSPRPVAQKLVWQGTGTHEAKGSVNLGITTAQWADYDGLWAAFQFMSEADWQQAGSIYNLDWKIRLEVGNKQTKLPTVRFELDMLGAPPVFQKGFFGRLGCVADVAR